VIGGGPGGAACALALALAGHSVLVVDKSEFPRFHIGESMIPYYLRYLERFGLLDEVKTGPFIHKLAVEVAFETGKYERIEFRHMAPGQHALAFNLERAKLDDLILSGARRERWRRTSPGPRRGSGSAPA
jgi:flavin-dependent dehydrogenase